jgi:hypothetical protein
MAWTDSRVFEAWIEQTMEASGTGYTGLDSDTIKAALFNNDVVPDRDAAVANTGYNTGTWVTADEVTSASDWPAGGIALSNKSSGSVGTGIYGFDADNTTHSNTVTLTDVHGCLVFDDTISAGTVADQGVSFHYFGGAQSVTAGTFTIVWHANGLFRITV